MIECSVDKKEENDRFALYLKGELGQSWEEFCLDLFGKKRDFVGYTECAEAVLNRLPFKELSQEQLYWQVDRFIKTWKNENIKTLVKVVFVSGEVRKFNLNYGDSELLRGRWKDVVSGGDPRSYNLFYVDEEGKETTLDLNLKYIMFLIVKII